MKNIEIKCKCGCGSTFLKYDKSGRERMFVLGHYMRVATELCRKRLSNALKGRVFSEEHKRKIGEKSKGRKLSDSAKLKISIANKGKKRTDEVKRKQSEMFKGRKLPPCTKEHREKISILAKIRLSIPENNPNWKGGITKESQKVRNSEEYKEWRNEVFKRDDYICQITRQNSNKLEVHHIINFSQNMTNFDITNGVTMRKDIHELFHKIYGKYNNTKEQLEEFKNNQ